MSLTHLTYLILNLNDLVDHELHRGVSLAEVKDHIRVGDVLKWLGERFAENIDVSLYSNNASARDGITNGLQRLLDGYSGNERRKWGVENNGICLLIAWTNELIQQRAWRD